jgi:hypothetical protein
MIKEAVAEVTVESTDNQKEVVNASGLERLVEAIEEKAFARRLNEGVKEPSTSDMYLELFSVREIEELIKFYSRTNDKISYFAA